MALGAVACCGCYGAPAVPLDEDSFLHTVRSTGRVLVDSAFVTMVEEGRIRLSVHVSNPSKDSIGIETGVCPFRLRGYATSELREPADWTDARREVWGCPDLGLVLSLPPGGADVVHHSLFSADLVVWPPPPETEFGIAMLLNDTIRIAPARRMGFER